MAKQAPDVFIPVLIGFLFYAFAGFITTRRGGGAVRGAWAGYWTALVGTITFWLTFGIGLGVLVFRQAQALVASVEAFRQHPDQAIQPAWESLNVIWPHIILLPKQSPLVNTLVWLGCGIVVAWLLGLIGGIVGSSRYRAKLEQRKQQQQKQQNPARSMQAKV
jgi:hypothetical protein